MRRIHLVTLSLFSTLALVGLMAASGVGCSPAHESGPATRPSDASVADGMSPDATAPIAFHPDAPTVYVARAKNVLLGLPPTDDEISQVQADPTRLKGLVLSWMQQPEYARKMMRFFELAFQQTQVSLVDFADQAYPRQIAVNATTTPLIVQNAQESFARTMLELIAQGHPFVEAATTPKVMMTTALKELYAFLDIWQVDDAGKVTDRFRQANPGLSIAVGTAQGPIPLAQTLDPASPNYMHWYNPDVATEDSRIPGCLADPIIFPSNGLALHWLLYGSLDNRKGLGGVACPQFSGTAAAPQLVPSDFDDWTMVTIRQALPTEPVSPFYDLPALRSATELVLSIPRIGFFSTPAFFANWPTNISNQMRVTMNQALIVALGSSVDGTDPTATPGNPPPGLDSPHASPGACFSCHRTLDPLRSIFSANYSWNYHNQVDSTLTAQKGLFSFRGVTQPVTNMSDLGSVMAQHPLFSSAWPQKLCYYVNSSPCSTTDPEFQRIVDLFKQSNYSWNVLVSEIFSSPLTTNAIETQTVDPSGSIVAVSRRDHFCAALDNRLGFADICQIDASKKKASRELIPLIVSGLPSDGYGRGSTIPVLPNQPSLFFRSATENICAAVADQVVDVPAASQLPNVKQWSSASPDAAIADFVRTLMALTSTDPRAALATGVLKAHYAAAIQQGASASDALKSTFVAACQAPSAISIGL